MKYLLLLMLVVCGGCISMNPCPYCYQKRPADIEHNEHIKADAGWTKNVYQKTWITYTKDNE